MFSLQTPKTSVSTALLNPVEGAVIKVPLFKEGFLSRGAPAVGFIAATPKIVLLTLEMGFIVMSDILERKKEWLTIIMLYFTLYTLSESFYQGFSD